MTSRMAPTRHTSTAASARNAGSTSGGEWLRAASISAHAGLPTYLAIRWAAAPQLPPAGVCGYKCGFSKVISLPLVSPSHADSRCTSRVVAEHPLMLVDSARHHFLAHESEPSVVCPPRFAAWPLRYAA